jgi:hypothetical protein
MWHRARPPLAWLEVPKGLSAILDRFIGGVVAGWVPAKSNPLSSKSTKAVHWGLDPNNSTHSDVLFRHLMGELGLEVGEPPAAARKKKSPP